MKKPEIKDIKRYATISLSLLGAIGLSSMFLFTNVVPSFPYKASYVKMKVEDSNKNVQSINNYLSINKEKSLEEMRTAVEEAQKETNELKEKLNQINIPNSVDYGSMMIFLQEKALQNYLQVLDIDFKDKNQQNQQQNPTTPEEEEEVPKPQGDTDKENETIKDENKEEENKEETEVPKEETVVQNTETSYPMIEKFAPSVVTVRLVGPYHNIEEYLEKVPAELGTFNFIDNLKLWKTNDTLAKQGVNLGDNTLFNDEKSMIVEFDIVMYNKI